MLIIPKRAPCRISPHIPVQEVRVLVAELCLSMSTGVFSRVVKEDSSPFFSGVGIRKEEKASKVAMLQMTAALHPGGSGRAIVNGEGRMISLVTRVATCS